MAALFAFAAIVQFNDPDPARWVTIYATAFLLSVLVALRLRVPPASLAVVAAIASGWALLIVVNGPAVADYSRMFGAWEMQSLAVEEAREASGLFIVAAWMIVLLVRSARLRSVTTSGRYG